MAKQITPQTRLQLIGLLTLAADNNRQQINHEKAVMRLLDQTETGGHCGDAVYNVENDSQVVGTADSLIKKLGFTVKDG